MGKQSMIFVILALTLGCQNSPNKTEYGTQGLGSSKMASSLNLPLAVFCSRTFSDRARSQIDLSLYLQMDGTYTAFLRSPLTDTKKPSPLIFEAIPGLDAEKRLLQRYKYEVPYVRFFGTFRERKFEVLFFPVAQYGKDTGSRVTPSPWQIGKATEGMTCSSRGDIISKSPRVGSELTVIGSVYDKIHKIHRQVSHRITVDFLTKSEGTDLILSLSNQIPQDAVPLHAPVLNQCGALVGFTKSYNPKDLFATAIYDIHDEKIREALTKNVILFQPRSPPPTDGVLSERLIQTLCAHTLSSVKHEPLMGFPSLGKIIATYCQAGTK